jgi:hypothetical protein
MHSNTVLPFPVFVRLIQAREYSAAIKTDRQILSTMGEVAHTRERNELMDDVLAVMLRAECAIVEKDLERIGPGSGCGGDGDRKGDIFWNFSMCLFTSTLTDIRYLHVMSASKRKHRHWRQCERITTDHPPSVPADFYTGI